MFKNSSSKRDGVLRSENYLTSHHEPDELVGRETEINRIADAVKPLAKRRKPDNLLVYGPSGVGKTTAVKHVFQHLENETRVKPVYINCWKYNTRPSLLTELLIRLGYPAPRKGKPVDELLSKLREWLNKNRGVMVALDEFDQLEDKTEVVYDLQLLNEETENKLGIVMVSNQHPGSLKLDPRSQSRLSMQTLQFNSYNAPQIERILHERVNKAFKPGTVPDQIIQEISSRVAEESGDCRKAIEHLLKAGRNADRREEKELKVDHLPLDDIQG